MPNYVALLRASFEAENEIEAEVIGELIRSNALKDLYEDEGDEVGVIDIAEFRSNMANEELVLLMRRTRNGLIATRIKQCWELARELDGLAWQLERRFDPDFPHTGYDVGRFIEISNEVLSGANPEI